MRYVTKSKYFNGSVGMWSDDGVTHAAEDGYTLCGRRVRGEKNGWYYERAITQPSASVMESQPTDVSGYGYCKRCAASLRRKEANRD